MRVRAGSASRRGPLAMVSDASFGAGICGCPALRLGLRMDGTWYSGPVRSAPALGHSRSLSLRAESHVPGLRDGLVRVVGRVRTPESGCDRHSRSRGSWSAPICGCL
jgi:hypothetical protein